MKRVAFLLAFVLCAILGLTLHQVSAAPPPVTTAHVQKPDSLMLAMSTTAADTAQAVVPSAVNLTRPVALPSEQASAADSCWFDTGWHAVPLDTVLLRRWRNRLQWMQPKHITYCPLHPDPGRCHSGLVSRVG